MRIQPVYAQLLHFQCPGLRTARSHEHSYGPDCAISYSVAIWSLHSINTLADLLRAVQAHQPKSSTSVASLLPSNHLQPPLRSGSLASQGPMSVGRRINPAPLRLKESRGSEEKFKLVGRATAPKSRLLVRKFH